MDARTTCSTTPRVRRVAVRTRPAGSSTFVERARTLHRTACAGYAACGGLVSGDVYEQPSGQRSIQTVRAAGRSRSLAQTRILAGQRESVSMPRDELDRRDHFLLKEYETAAKLTYHIDTMRDRLTTFFVTVAGIAVAGLSIVLRSDTRDDRDALAVGVVATLFILVATLGGLIVVILARLRKAQIEHFRIINNIREHFLGDDTSLWNVVELSRVTLPSPNRRSGTFMWLAAILAVTAVAAALGTYVLLDEVIHHVSTTLTWVIAGVVLCLVPLGLQGLYISLAVPPPRPRYGYARSPFDSQV